MIGWERGYVDINQYLVYKYETAVTFNAHDISYIYRSV